VKGGQVVYGGAPLHLIVRKVEEVQAVFYRTAEMLLCLPLRTRGGPTMEVQSVFTPWLFQAPAGSYQFAVRVQEPLQTDLFPEARPRVEKVASTFLSIVRATATGTAALPRRALSRQTLRQSVPERQLGDGLTLTQRIGESAVPRERRKHSGWRWPTPADCT
jgi:hypothetical protein